MVYYKYNEAQQKKIQERGEVIMTLIIILVLIGITPSVLRTLSAVHEYSD